MKYIIVLISFIMLNLNLFGQVIFEVDASQKGKEMSQDLIGIFFEDINYAADGGLYAELVQNRSFEYYPVSGYVTLEELTAWSLIKEGAADATMQIENSNPLNENNTKYLKLTINDAGTGAGIKNTGFNGISVEKNEKYDFSVYLKGDESFTGALIVRIANSNGNVLGSDTIDALTQEWTKYTLEIQCNETVTNANLQIVTTGNGILYFDMVSLFPQNTFNNRKNGLRIDLAQALLDLKPRFLRFPGGCISHGRGIDNAYRWKATIGDVAQRKPNWNLWGYHQTYGLGFFEYFLFCEDIGAKPLPVLPIGISCQFRNREIVSLDKMDPWVEDAIDLIEFANGPVTSEWGKIRSDMGHPEPFNLEYLCLGNEEDDIPEFRERFKLITEEVRKTYPEIKIFGTSGTAASGNYYNSLWKFSEELNLDAVDEHYYMSPSWFLSNINRYDNFDRSGPKVFIGEYASKDDRLSNAIAEAAYLTGVEKNSDIIQFTCYAPLLSKENYSQWHPNLIRFDNTRVARTASYYVQQLYSLHSGDEYINSSISYDADFTNIATEFNGSIGVGTWNTQSDFDDIKVVCGDKVLIADDFGTGSSNWQVASGTFNLSGGIYSQSSVATPAVSTFKEPLDTSVYTYTLKAKRNSGGEGFLIPFAYKDSRNFYWFNIAGWNNTQHAVEKSTDGTKTLLVSKSGSITSNTWYDIKIEITKETAKFYLNNELLFEIPAPENRPVVASACKDDETNDLIIKMVNSGSASIKASMNIKEPYINQDAQVITLTGSASDRNSLSSPGLIIPVETTFHVTNSFDYTLAPNSFQVFRIKMDKEYQGINDLVDKKDKSHMQITPNPMVNRAQIIFENPSQKNFTLYLFDSDGKQVLKRKDIKGNSAIIERGNLFSGIYFVKLTAEGNIYTGKMVITPK